jgi:hypothetical protein
VENDDHLNTGMTLAPNFDYNIDLKQGYGFAQHAFIDNIPEN